jgi:MraZ protein
VEERGGGVAELLGTHSYSLDPKGRVSLPARFRAAFDDGLWLTVGQDRCLYCFPRAEWERRSREVGAFALSDKDGRAFSRLFFSAADEVRLDAQGRVTIPQRLRDAVGINKEVVVLGVRERIEIWDRAEFERYRDAHADAYENGDLEPRGARPAGGHSGFDRGPRTTEG